MANPTHRVAAAIAIGMVMLHAADARAGGILSWLGRMSGPGPFVGINVGYCRPLSKDTHSPPPHGEAESPGTQAVRSAGITFCTEPQRDYFAPHWTFYVNGGIAKSLSNNLQYTGPSAYSVWTLSSEVTLGYNVLPSIELGGGAGLRHFMGDNFRGFVRPYIVPAQVTVRPALFGRHDLKTQPTKTQAFLRSISLTARWDLLLADLDGASFGATAESFAASYESRLGVDVGLRVCGYPHPHWC